MSKFCTNVAMTVAAIVQLSRLRPATRLIPSKAFPLVRQRLGKGINLPPPSVALGTVNPTYSGPMRIFDPTFYSQGVLRHKRLRDQFIQEWQSRVAENSVCCNYRYLKRNFALRNISSISHLA